MGDLELRQVQYFVAVAEHLHFGRAAEALSVGQPAVSQQVARLERILGTKLLDRSPRTVRLTESGSRFLPYARGVLAAAERARAAALGRCGSQGAQVIRIGTCSGLGDRLTAMLRVLQDARPTAKTELVSVGARARLERVAAGQLDAAFIRGVKPHEGIELIDVWTDRLLVALPAGHELAQGDAVRLRDLAALDLRIVSRPLNPVLVDQVINACEAAGFHPTIADRPESFENLIAAIASGAPSWSVVYESHARMLAQSQVAFRPVAPSMVMTTSLAVRADASSREIAPLIAACAAADKGSS